MSPKGLILEVTHLSLYVSSLTGKHPEKNILHFTRNFVETGFCSWACGGGIYCVVFTEKSSTKSDPAWKPFSGMSADGESFYISQKTHRSFSCPHPREKFPFCCTLQFCKEGEDFSILPQKYLKSTAFLITMASPPPVKVTTVTFSLQQHTTDSQTKPA